MIGQTLSHYRILGSLGAGGMGVVYLAEDERLGRQVALKFLPADAVENQQALDRFRLEARTASSLSHPGICAIHDIGLHESTPFIVMELLRGESLRERVLRGPMKVAEVLDIGIQLADALGAAHAQGIVHRDIKPANIFIGDKLRVKILDFGLAKFAREQPRSDTMAAADVTAVNDSPRYDNQLTTPGTAIGTVSYMSPEQARGEEVDARTDIFSLGVVLYEMVTGRQAFVGSTSAVVFDAILNRAPMSPVLLNPETPPRLQEAINTALEKERDLRYQHAADLEADLKRIRRDLQSGQTASVSRANAETVAWQPAATPTAITTLSPPVTAPTAAASAAGISVDTTATASRSRVLWVAAVIAAAAVGAALWFQAGRPVVPGNPAAVAGADEEVRRARVRFDARDYRAALAEASAALTHDPGNAEATRIRADAQARLADLEGLLTAATTAIAASDGVGAAGLLATAQELAPGVARVAEVSARLRGLPEAARPQAPPAPRPAPPVDRPVGRPAAAAPAESPPPTPADASPQPSPSPPVVTTAPPPSLPVSAPVEPAPPVVEATPPAPSPPPVAAPPPARESDDAAIRRVIGIYERAIESKDLTLFRSVRPSLSADEERRLRAGFEQVDRQEIDIRIESIAVIGDTATVRLARQDVVQRGGRSQTAASSQTLRLARRGTGWIIVELSR
jgi:serine/threonine protein kinase